MFKEKNIDWDNVYKKYCCNIDNYIGEKEFIKIINKMLLELNDPHVTFKDVTSKLKYTMPFKIKFVENKLMVSTDYKIPKGSEILKVDSIDIKELINSYPDKFPFAAIKMQVLEKIYSSINENTKYQYMWNEKNYSIQIKNSLVNYDLAKILPVQNKNALANNINIKKLTEKIEYIRIQFFTDSISTILQNWFFNLEKGKSLIIDLRDSYGGNVDETIKSVSFFLEQCVNLGTKIYRTNDKEIEEKVSIKPPIKNYHFEKIIVLVNNYTMSSSEFIFLRAITENINTTVIGKITSGIVHGAKRFLIDNKYLLTLTTFKYYDKNGNLLKNIGFVPDLIVPDSDEFIINAINNYFKSNITEF